MDSLLSASQAGVAQLVEQRIRNAKVVGSTPISGTIIKYVTLKPNIYIDFSVHVQIVNTKNNTKYWWGYPLFQGRGEVKTYC